MPSIEPSRSNENVFVLAITGAGELQLFARWANPSTQGLVIKGVPTDLALELRDYWRQAGGIEANVRIDPSRCA